MKAKYAFLATLKTRCENTLFLLFTDWILIILPKLIHQLIDRVRKRKPRRHRGTEKRDRGRREEGRGTKKRGNPLVSVSPCPRSPLCISVFRFCDFLDKPENGCAITVGSRCHQPDAPEPIRRSGDALGTGIWLLLPHLCLCPTLADRWATGIHP
jgi:hypothetical protein